MTSASPTAPGAPGHVLTALVARLREADLGPTAEEVADALWLARWVGPAPWPGGRIEPPEPPAGTPADPHAHEPPPAPSGPGSTAAAPSEGRAGLRTPHTEGHGPAGGADRRGGSPVRVPTAPTLPHPLALQRALRPLQQFRSPSLPVRRVLDEQATAHRAAETGLTLPVLRPSRRREARAQLLMDVSSSTIVWEQTLDELREIFERAGAFREVRVLYLHEDTDGRPGASATLRPGQRRLRPPSQFADPTGKQLTLLLSDCAGPMWRSGALHRLLHRWAAAGPVAVVQPLPQRMWRNTHLPAWPGLLRRPEGPAGRLEFLSRDRPPRHAVPVPVLAPHRVALETWARLLSGSGELTLRAAAGWVDPDPLPAPAPAAATGDVPADERLRAFRRHASPAATRLARWLSTAPLQLPVMQLVQRAMLPGSGPDVLAEVLLGGLLRRSDTGTGDPAYTFHDGVREELNGQLGPGEAELAFKHLSRYLESRFGRTVRNFPAMAAAYLSGTVERPGPPTGADSDPLLREFAVVSTRVLRRSLPPPARPAEDTPQAGPGDLADRARARLARFRDQGTARDLDWGVELLTGAVRSERRAAPRALLNAELAGALLERWQVRRLGEDLKDALAAAEAAAEEVPSAHRTVADVLLTAADEVRAAGADSDAVPDRFRTRIEEAGAGRDPGALQFVLLEAAERALAQAAAAGGESGHEAAIVRIAVLEQLITGFEEQAVLLHRPPPTASADWYETKTAETVEVLDSLITTDPVPARYFRGRVRAQLAAHYAAQQGTRPRAERARDTAVLACADLTEALPQLSRALPAAPGAETAPDERSAQETWSPSARDLVGGWVALAESWELAGAGHDEEGGREGARVALAEGRAVAEAHASGAERDELVADCLERLARVEAPRPGEPEEAARRRLDRVVEIWDEAVRRTPRDSPEYAGRLEHHGSALSDRAVAGGTQAEKDSDDAVRLLRRAVALTSETDPDLAGRRCRLGRALLRRFRTGAALTDLHEADWILGAAARGADSADIRAVSHATRGEVAEELGRATGATARFADAAAHYLKASEAAYADGALRTAARFTEARAELLRVTAGPGRALDEYRRALALLAEHGDEQSPDAERLRRAVRGLESGDA
ncbi:SAV_2336 N-terminal domain-related protein [Streptomyces sp. NPDC015127]|uniref:SAV_2336 N-terminal domain-related protein n=1 Tax=Streptomyces sp. NPDC015127 TaxID=3364939 RepID=UPI0036FCF70D